MDKVKLQKVLSLDGEMTKVKIDLEVDVVESLVKERRRQEDQVKIPTTKTLTSEESRKMKRLDYDTVGGKALIMFLEEEVEVDAWRREEGEIQDDDDEDEIATRFLVEYVFIAVPIDESKEEESDKDDAICWYGERREKKREERRR